jgi:hypothetical protein
MAVWCRQSVEGAPQEPYAIEPHFDGQTDADLLALKAKGAHDKGWSVEFTGPRSFTAVKVRWLDNVECIREFWADG